MGPIYGKFECAEWSDMLRWSQIVIDLADGDPARGSFLIGSPLAIAIASRGIAGYHLGQDGWRDDLRHGLAMGRSADPMSHASVVAWVYNLGIPCGVLSADDAAKREIEDALHNAERSADDVAMAIAGMTLGMAQVHRQTTRSVTTGSSY